MGPFNRKAAEVVEEVVAIEAEAMSTAVMAVLGFIAFLYGATVIVFLYQESKVGWKKITRWLRNLVFVFAVSRRRRRVVHVAATERNPHNATGRNPQARRASPRLAAPHLHVSPRRASPRLASPRLASPRLSRHRSLRWPIRQMLAGATVMIIPSLVVYLVGGSKKGMHFACYLMRTYFKIMGPILWGPFTFEGTENLPDGSTPTIYCANHQSSVDFCTIFCLPNGPPAVSVAKSSMMFLPGFGQMISLMGGIMVSRGKKGTLAMLLEIGVQRLKSGLSVGIFPQGTRTVPKKGEPLRGFKIGCFKLAVEGKVPVVPFTIIYPDDFMCSSGNPPGVKVIIHPRVEPGDDADKLMKTVEKLVLDPLMKETGDPYNP
mmetsp:Transcript_37044/g.99886  ORF Transcript_37044/g.99886 Transcript_37044/m.99886 type:complete len:375 (-) Transcript_37044:1339-2463(-)